MNVVEELQTKLHELEVRYFLHALGDNTVLFSVNAFLVGRKTAIAVLPFVSWTGATRGAEGG